MQFSSILVVARPTCVPEVVARLEEIPGVEVYARHEETGRLVVVQEAPDAAAHESGFHRIQDVPGVVSARLVRVVAETDEVAG